MRLTRKIRILLVEDSVSMGRLYLAYLTQSAYTLKHVETGQTALTAIESFKPDLVLLDLELPDMSGMDILRTYAKKQKHQPAFIIVTGHGSVDTAVEAVNLGAKDFIEKPIEKSRLLLTVNNVIDHLQLTQKLRQIESTRRHGFHGFIGSSLPMQAVYQTIENAAESKASIFITGESGTGKEECARAVHAQSGRSDSAFIPINCASIPENLMESEIFGHLKGSFTGASSNRSGAATLADGGTLFLDELCEMQLDIQAKLLRFIQTGEFQPLGSSKVHQSDVRIVCATNRNPFEEVQQKRFREDLFYRLHVIPIHLPPLRDRDQDVLRIAESLMVKISEEENKHYTGFGQKAKQLLLQHDWPGNVRELQNLIRRIIIMQNGPEISADALSTAGLNQVAQNGPDSFTMPETSTEDKVLPLHQIERQAIEHALNHFGGDIPRAAVALEVNPSTIYRKLKLWSS